MNPFSMFGANAFGIGGANPLDPAAVQQQQQMMLAAALLGAAGKHSRPEGANLGNALMQGMGAANQVGVQAQQMQMLKQQRDLQQQQIQAALAAGARQRQAQERVRAIMGGQDPNVAARIAQGGPFKPQPITPEQQRAMLMGEIPSLGDAAAPLASLLQPHSVAEGGTGINALGQTLAQGAPRWHAGQPGATLYRNTPSGVEMGPTLPGMDATERFLMGLAAADRRFFAGQAQDRARDDRRYARQDEDDDVATLASLSQFTRLNQFGMPAEVPDLDARQAVRPFRSPKYDTPENRARQALVQLPPQVRTTLIGGSQPTGRGGTSVSGTVGQVVTAPDGTEFVRHVPPSGPPVLMFRPKGAKDWKRFDEQ